MSKANGKQEGVGFQPDGLPPCLITVDKEGRMWHQGAEMLHRGINSLLRQNVDLDQHGRYVISFHGQRCYVEVEDTFFVIQRVDFRPASSNLREALLITLNDECQEELDPAGLSQSGDNVMYAQVKGGRFPARFLRRAYYQLADYISEKNGRYVISLNGRDYPVA